MDAWETMVQALGDATAGALEAARVGAPAALVLAEGLGRALGAEAVCAASLDLAARRCDLVARPVGLDVAPLREAALRTPREHPVLAHWLAGHTGAAAVSSVVTDPTAWRRSATRELLRTHLGCTETGGIRTDRGVGPLQMVGFARERDLSADELSLLEAVSAPVVAVAQHASWLATLRQQAREARGAEAPGERAGSCGLTSREHQVLDLLAQGLLAETIARRLSISPRTVHRHLSGVYTKLGTHDRLGTVLRARELGLLVSVPTPRAASDPIAVRRSRPRVTG